MLIDRKDNPVNLFEMKFYADKRKIITDYARNLRKKRAGLKMAINTRKMIHTFITPFGVFDNQQKIDVVDHDLDRNIFDDRTILRSSLGRNKECRERNNVNGQRSKLFLK